MTTVYRDDQAWAANDLAPTVKHMALCAELRNQDGNRVLGLKDPAGGIFDAAGDFDRLLGAVPSALTWSTLDPHSDTCLDSEGAARLSRELHGVRATSRPGPERRGLDRLAILLEYCSSTPGSLLWFLGD